MFTKYAELTIEGAKGGEAKHATMQKKVDGPNISKDYNNTVDSEAARNIGVVTDK